MHSLTPVAFFLILANVHAWDMRRFTAIRLVGYYSYNLYLWHMIFVFMFKDWFGITALGFALYFATAMVAAVLATALVEEPLLDWRDRLARARQVAAAETALVPEPILLNRAGDLH